MKTILKILVPFALLAAYSCTQAGESECHIKTPSAIACTTPEAAATVFQQFGFNTQLSSKDYNRELLHKAGCKLPFSENFKMVKLELMSAGRIATRDGWVNVSDLLIDHHDFYFVASAYISGECKKYTPPEMPIPARFKKLE